MANAHRHDDEAHPRQQELFVLVDAALDRDEGRGIPFDEEVINLDDPEFKARVTAVSGTGKVPALIDGDIHVWESLAILDYLADKFPEAGLWPADPQRGGMRARWRRRCTPASGRCAAIVR